MDVRGVLYEIRERATAHLERPNGRSVEELESELEEIGRIAGGALEQMRSQPPAR